MRFALCMWRFGVAFQVQVVLVAASFQGMLVLVRASCFIPGIGDAGGGLIPGDAGAGAGLAALHAGMEPYKLHFGVWALCVALLVVSYS